MAVNACTHSHIPFSKTDLSATTTFWQCTFQKLQAVRAKDARNCMEKKTPQILFIFFLAKERMLWHRCRRWMVDEAWLLVTCDAKMPDLYHFQFTGLMLLFLLKPPYSMDLPLQRSRHWMLQNCAGPPAPIWGDHSGDHFSELACFIISAVIELPGFLLLPALWEQVFTTLKLSNCKPDNGGWFFVALSVPLPAHIHLAKM